MLRWLLIVLALLVVGAGGFFLGGAMGAATGAAGGSLVGTLSGVCKTAEIAQSSGLLSAEQQAQLVEATAEALRAAFPEVAQAMQAPEAAPYRLTPENCPRILEMFQQASRGAAG